MIGPLMNIVQRAAEPTLGRIFAESAVRAAAHAAGVAAVAGVVCVVRQHNGKDGKRGSCNRRMSYNYDWRQ